MLAQVLIAEAEAFITCGMTNPDGSNRHWRLTDAQNCSRLISLEELNLEDVKPQLRSFLSCAESRLNLFVWASLASISACNISLSSWP
jgi:hypothetical protein